MRSCGRISYKLRIKGDNKRVSSYWQGLKTLIKIGQVVTTIAITTTITTTDNNHKHNKKHLLPPNNNNNQTLTHHRYNM